MKVANRRTLLVGLAVATAWLAAAAIDAGCGSARRGIPVAEPVELSDPTLISGRQLFMANCHQCHPGGAAGLGPSINDKPLPGFAMRMQIRQGLGAMPAFNEELLSDEEVDEIVSYLNHLQSLDPPEFRELDQ